MKKLVFILLFILAVHLSQDFLTVLLLTAIIGPYALAFAAAGSGATDSSDDDTYIHHTDDGGGGTNPATGLQMIGSTDGAGNFYGMNNFHD